MRTLTKILLVTGGASAVGLTTGIAGAQNDVTPHLPNVLLLLDTSGSMENVVPPDPSDPLKARLVIPGASGAPAGSACAVTPNAGYATTVMNRWAQLVTTLTGTIPTGPLGSFGCEAVQRNTAAFVNEYQFPSGGTPYDYNYYLPFHRIYSNGCTVGAGQLPNNWDWTKWPDNAFDFHTSSGLCRDNPANCCDWTGQYSDGLLDAFSGLVRFGLMTFDQLPDPGTGAQYSPPRMDETSAKAGNWSYFHNWMTYGGSTPQCSSVTPNNACTDRPANGRPNACNAYRFMEVGARNPSAPPWEGRMIPFGDPNSDDKIAQSNANIQWEILAMRPFGATPIAGMLDDAREFLFKDDSKLPGSTTDFGPRLDPYWVNGCRKTYIILLTDGDPNLDLRGPNGQCDNVSDPTNPGKCPYDPPDSIIYDMRTNAPTSAQSVTTFVVGFAMSNPANLPGGKTSCAQVDPTTDCTSPPESLRPCCTLQKLARAGKPGQNAYFADDPTQLKAALSAILSSIVGGTTSRTSPVYSAAGLATTQGGGLGTPASSYHFAASFNVTSAASAGKGGNAEGSEDDKDKNTQAGGLWTGNLVRERYSCSSGNPVPQAIDASKGDDFAANLDSNDASHPRQFWTVIGDTDGNKINSDNSIRPWLLNDDNFGLYGWESSANPIPPSTDTAFLNAVSPWGAAFNIETDKKACKDAFGAKPSSTCVNFLMNYEIGNTNALPPKLSPAVSRDPSSTYCLNKPGSKPCSKLGAIYHSTPVVVGPPREFLRDDTYVTYANDADNSTQPQVLYTASIDGQLHAFQVQPNKSGGIEYTVDSKVNNELWSFFPPAVLKRLMPNYNTGGAKLLDGAPVVVDVPGYTDNNTTPPKFERTSTSSVNWHRVLVAGGGEGGGFYYALDVTRPRQPRFLWQLSTDQKGNPFFGDTTPKPAVAIVALKQSGTRVQIPVAILSGGTGNLANNCNKPPTAPDRSKIQLNDARNPSNPSGTVFNLATANYPPLRCWGQDGDGLKKVTGNSVTIVRLDTGEILMHFIGKNYVGSIKNGKKGGDDNNDKADNARTVDFTAPITGIPVVYPGETGQVAERVYVGDADGQLWRINLTGDSVSAWTVELAWDAYLDNAGSVRESIQLAPVLSRDPIGNTVIMFATGDQNQLTAQQTDNRVWSITETPLFNSYTSQNWYIKFGKGDRRVTGPMQVFNNVLYFATYMPQSQAGNVCSDGFGSVWAVDYRRADPSGVPYNGLPIGMFPSNPPVNPAPRYADGAVGTVIYGVSVAETPSCNTTQTSSDPYFGSGTQVGNVGASEYRVMWQTGAGTGISNGAVKNEGISRMQNMTVPPPGQATRIDSWAALVE
jgi:type IV pilus assembly protein PilY1